MNRPRYGAARVVPETTEREFIATFGLRSGMYIGHTTLHGVTSFLNGYDVAARRHGGPGLDGFREWLIANYDVATNLAWCAQIEQIVLPERDFRTPLSQTDEERVLAAIFELLDKFLATRSA